MVYMKSNRVVHPLLRFSALQQKRRKGQKWYLQVRVTADVNNQLSLFFLYADSAHPPATKNVFNDLSGISRPVVSPFHVDWFLPTTSPVLRLSVYCFSRAVFSHIQSMMITYILTATACQQRAL